MTVTPEGRRARFGGHVKDPLPWNPLPYMEEYLLELELQDRNRDYIRMARVGLSRFAAFCETENIRHPDEITRATILRYQGHLVNLRNDETGEPFAVSYRQQLLKYIRTWINWLEGVEHIQTSPWVRIKVGSTPKKPRPLEEDEVAALFEAHRRQAFQNSPFYYHRRESALVLLYAWGLRIHELLALNVVNMDVRLEWVTAINKGGGTKVLPYNPEIKQVVGRWLRHRTKYALVGDDALFIGQDGKRMTSNSLYKIIVELGQRAGVAVNPHRLRDTFGTTMLDHDVPVERIMKMMGHTNQAQTLAYSRVNDSRVAESHEAVVTPLLKQLIGGPLP